MKIIKWFRHIYYHILWNYTKEGKILKDDVNDMFCDIQHFLSNGSIIDDITILVNNRIFLITAGTHTRKISDYFPVSDEYTKERIDYLVKKYPLGQISITKNDIYLISKTYNLIGFKK